MSLLAILLALISLVWGLPTMSADAARSGAVPKSLCAKYDRGVQDGFCIKDGRGGLYWLGTLRGYGGVEMYCIDYLFATSWGVAHKRITLSGKLPTSLGGSVDAATTAALTYVVTRNPASGVNDTTAAAIGLIIRQVMGDVRNPGGPTIPGGLTANRDVRGVSFVNPTINSRAKALWAEARVHRGPWSVQVKVEPGVDGRFLPGDRVRATVRGSNGSRKAQDMTVALSYGGFTGPSSVRLGADGVATVTLVAPKKAQSASVSARVTNAPSALPVLIRPNSWQKNPRPGQASLTSQRGLVGRQSEVTAADRVVVEVHYGPSVVTQTSAAVASPGAVLTDLVTIKGAYPDYVGPVTAILYGPFPADPGPGSCTGAPVAGTVRMPVRGDGSYRTPGVKVGSAGYYTWVEVLPGLRNQTAVRTPCGVASETTVVRSTPEVVTQTSQAEAGVGAEITDRVRVSGTAPGYSATVSARLYGPYSSRAAMTCAGAPYREVSFPVRGDGTYVTPKVRLDAAGYFTWVETFPGAHNQNALRTPCGVVSETTVVRSTPEVVTQTSQVEVEVGAEITDRVRVSGTAPGYSATVSARLYGPYSSRAAMTCAGAPYREVSFPVRGDGTYVTPKVRLDAAGYFTWVETFPGDDLTTTTTTKCGLVSETTLALRTPPVPVRPSVPAGGSRLGGVR